MKSRNIWTTIVFAIGLGLVLLGIIEPYAELLGFNSQWVGLIVLLLGGIKQYIEQKGLISEAEANEQTARFANDMNYKKENLSYDDSEVNIKNIDNSKVTVKGVRGSHVTVQDVEDWKSKG